MIRIVIVDDQPVLLRGLRLLLAAQADMQIVGEAADPQAALDVCYALHPDIALVDGEMIGRGALATAQALRAACPRAQVIVIGLYDDPETRQQAAGAGVVCFVSKQAPLDMLAAIREAVRS